MARSLRKGPYVDPSLQRKVDKLAAGGGKLKALVYREQTRRAEADLAEYEARRAARDAREAARDAEDVFAGAMQARGAIEARFKAAGGK